MMCERSRTAASIGRRLCARIDPSKLGRITAEGSFFTAEGSFCRCEG